MNSAFPSYLQHSKSLRSQLTENAVDSSFKMLKSQLLPEIFKFPLQLVGEQHSAQMEAENARIRHKFVLAHSRQAVLMEEGTSAFGALFESSTPDSMHSKKKECNKHG